MLLKLLLERVMFFSLKTTISDKNNAFGTLKIQMKQSLCGLKCEIFHTA